MAAQASAPYLADGFDNTLMPPSNPLSIPLPPLPMFNNAYAARAAPSMQSMAARAPPPPIRMGARTRGCCWYNADTADFKYNCVPTHTPQRHAVSATTRIPAVAAPHYV